MLFSLESGLYVAMFTTTHCSMIPLDLSKTLANRKKFIDEVSDISIGHGTNTCVKTSEQKGKSSQSGDNNMCTCNDQVVG